MQAKVKWSGVYEQLLYGYIEHSLEMAVIDEHEAGPKERDRQRFDLHVSVSERKSFLFL